MKSNDLRELQAPLKKQYKDDPSSARMWLRAQGTLDNEAIQCDVQSFLGAVPTGLHPATGGDGNAACSANMLLEALVGCAGVTLRAVATALNIDVRGGTITAEGNLDFRGTLGVAKDAPVGLNSIRLHFDLQGDADDAQVDKLVQLTERYCVVLQTLKSPPSVSISRSIAP